jgi:hypothetical protein
MLMVTAFAQQTVRIAEQEHFSLALWDTEHLPPTSISPRFPLFRGARRRSRRQRLEAR